MTPSTLARMGIAGAAFTAFVLAAHVHGADSSFTSFDELPRQSANGLSYAGFQFSSPDAIFNDALPGPGYAGLVDDHALVGLTSATLGIAFETPPKFFGLTFALNTFQTEQGALRITYYDLGDNLLGTEDYDTDALARPGEYPSGQIFKYTWLDFDWPTVKVSRIELDFSGAGDTYAIDNLYAQYTGEPIPESGTLGAGAVVAVLACRAWQFHRRSKRDRGAAAGGPSRPPEG